MSAAGTPSTDPWVILAKERARYEEQFKSLKPKNGVVTGDQAKGFFLQSQLPPIVLGQIWALADTNSDGKMDLNEFSIACKLINLKLRGFDIPKGLPPSLLASLQQSAVPIVPPLPNPILINPALSNQPLIPQLNTSGLSQTVIPNLPPVIPNAMAIAQAPPALPTNGFIGAPHALPSLVPSAATSLPLSGLPLVGSVPPVNVAPINMAPVNVAPVNVAPLNVAPVNVAPVNVTSAGPSATSTPRSSIPNLDKVASVESLQLDWAVPHQTKLKYTQIFNSTDRTRSGFLSGAQARNVMVQTKLPQNTLAQIWGLSDMDSDGRLGCEEFVLAMHLCEQASLGTPPPAKLPADLIPPSFRRVARTSSISSQGSVHHMDADALALQTSFEDKRKENFEKGQAELERRRKALQDQQRKEAEERERKEREEFERREKARLEAERKRIDELERQMREQQEQERLKEEERKRQAEQREAARKEMELQRQLEWEKQRLQEFQQQRQREQETVLKLKAKNQSLTIELSSLNEQVKQLSQRICDTRLGVSNVKTVIDGMRSTRDTQMHDMAQLKNQLKEQNNKLLALSQEKVKLEARNKFNTAQDPDQARIAFENKEITIKNLREKIEDMQREIDGKLSDIQNNNTQLTDLRGQLTELVENCEKLYGTYEEKRGKVLEMQAANQITDVGGAWRDTEAWGDNDNQTATDWPVDNSWPTQTTTAPSVVAGYVRYRALYEFEARNGDEISFQPGDIINVPTKQTGEPGWLAGEIRGHTGWFPESYVEPVDGVDVRSIDQTATADTYVQETESTPLEEIAETAEVSDAVLVTQQSVEASLAVEDSNEPVEYFIANYPYKSQEPGDLTFNAGDVIAVLKQDGDWWTGKSNGAVGIFPRNYVQKVDVSAAATAVPTNEATAPAAISVNSSTAVENTNQIDNEVSELTEIKATEQRPLDASITSSAQTLKGKKPEIASVIAPYEATSPEQLSLARGQLIMIRKKTDSGWWQGELQAKGRKRQVGWFPASYVKVMNSSGKISGRTTPVSTTRIQQEVVLDKVVALFPYTAGNPDELSFNKDDIISVTAREEESWWRGEVDGVSGLFPSNYVAPLQQQSNTDSKKRQEAIRELIHTERVYVADMLTVHEVFEAPMKKSLVVEEEQMNRIFLNWLDILKCNRKFLTDLEHWENAGSTTNLGYILYNHLQNMQAYESFCRRQLDSAALLQKLTDNSLAFRNLVKKCQNNPSTKGMPLSSFLIKPMQRITKYPLLIGKIIENTSEDHSDYEMLQKALKSAEQFLNDVNENVREKENQEKYDWLQSNIQNDLNIVFNSETNKLGPRLLLHHSILTKVKSGKDLIALLFSDFFMLVQPSKKLGQFTFQKIPNVTYKVYKQPILIQDLSISRESSEQIEQGTDSNRVLKLADNRHKFTVCLLASTINECNLWTKRIQSAKEVYAKVDGIIQNKSKPKVQSGKYCGRLLVYVQKGHRFVSSADISAANRRLDVAVVDGSEISYICDEDLILNRKGKPHTDNVYCLVNLGDQKHSTDLSKDQIINGNNNQTNGAAPQVPAVVWNCNMQFHLRNIDEETLTFKVFGSNLYSPDEFLGCAELKVSDVLRESQNTNGPITKKLILHQVESGELTVKLDLHLFS